MRKPKYQKFDESRSSGSAKKEKRFKKEFWWTLFIAFIMIFSVIGFLYVGEDNSAFTYKEKFKFARQNNDFVYNYQGQSFAFKFFPSDVEELAKQVDTSKLKKPMVSFTFDPNSDLVQYMDLVRFELSNDLPKLNVYLAQGVTNESELYSLPVIDCKDASISNPVIKFVLSNDTFVSESNYCFVFNAKNEYDMLKLKDLVVYKMLGIVE